MINNINPRVQTHSLQRFAIVALLTTIFGLLSLGAQAKCSKDEVGYVATFDVKPGSEAAFEAAVSQLSETVMRVESGVILYAPYKGTGATYYMLERYENEAARKEHGTSEEVQALFGPLGATLAGAPDVQPTSAVCP